MEELSAQISENVASIMGFLRTNGHPEPSFAVDGPPSYPNVPEIMGPRAALVQAASDLLHLALGPDQYWRYSLFTVSKGKHIIT